ncbi:MAG: hypothetical protein IPM83_03480 [Ignavibacteria bacterium]|nr:hypothetical protein [Ignavibacteria bacterium]
MNMKIKLTTLVVAAALSVLQMRAQCDTTGQKIIVSAQPATVLAGLSIQLVTELPATIPPVAAVRLSAYVDGQRATVLAYTSRSVDILLPASVGEGTHTAWFCIDDGPFGSASITVTTRKETLDTAIDKTDPDPRTNNGPRQDLSGAGRRPHDDGRRDYPNGGHGGSLPCSERHVIDGTFTRLADSISREWAGIPPMIGRFSHMYLDYCAEKGAMYLLNDWLLGTGSYKQNCYNVFEFTTGNGREQWKIKVTHDSVRPVIVVLNGADVTDDTTLVLGGGFGYGASPSDTTPHTIYEFGVKVSDGLFMLPYGGDPVEYKPATGVSLDCDESITTGYGLIYEPNIRSAHFSSTGVSTQQYERYIPTSGIIGLEIEPNIVTGECGGDSIRYRSGNGPMVTNRCNSRGVVDGIYTAEEWSGCTPVVGQYSNLYAQFCSGTLHILNDWIYATAMPNNATCYNLFELFTGNGREHWGIWVFQDAARKPRVFRNGVEVTEDTTIVKSGLAGWGGSPRLEAPHAMYEFQINAMEGGFSLQYADPGPASFCTTETSSADDEGSVIAPVMLQPQPYRQSDGPLTLTFLPVGATIDIIDVRSRTIYSTNVSTSNILTISFSQKLAAGRYTVRVITERTTQQLPLMVLP